MGEKYFQEFGPNFFMGGPRWGPPTWAQAWAQAPPAPPPAPDEFSDPNLTPLPTHPRIKYVARTLAAIYMTYCLNPKGNHTKKQSKTNTYLQKAPLCFPNQNAF